MSHTRPDLERAWFLTESFKQTEGQPMVIRRAKALENILNKMSIYINEAELIVGNESSTLDSAPLYPEYSYKTVDENSVSSFSEIDRKTFLQITDYWKGKSVQDRVEMEWPEDVRRFVDWPDGRAVYFHSHRDGFGGYTPDYNKIIKIGLNGIIENAEKKLAELVPLLEHPPKGEHQARYYEKKYFYEATIIACKAFVSWIHRYAKLARTLAERQTEPQRKEELEKIAEVCEQVPTKPARTFHEALQALYSIWLMTHFIEIPRANFGVRLDRVTYPYYKEDAEAGRITRPKALELLECFYLKIAEVRRYVSAATSATHQGAPGLLSTLVLGGIDENGFDVTNDVSYLTLEATKELSQMTSPEIKFRVHAGTPDELIKKSFECLAAGSGGRPAFYNDLVYIQFFLERGIPLEWARNFTIGGCVRPELPGEACGILSSIHISVPKALELALNNGIDMMNGEKVGIPTGDPSTFKSYEDVVEAFKKQFYHIIDVATYAQNVVSMIQVLYTPIPLCSAFMDQCMERGEDIGRCMDDVSFPGSNIYPVGINHVVDSFAAIKKLVFEDRKIGIEKLVDALKRNFEGKEELRQMLINRAPKFGNDDDYVDLIARDVFEICRQTVLQFRDAYGHAWNLSPQTISSFVPQGRITAATPDGRKAGEPFHDGGVSPVYGRDVNGPTAVLKSVSKLDHPKLAGALLNQKLSPEHWKGEVGVKRFVDFIKTFIDLGISHVQFNIVDARTLKEAQKYPEKYQNLVVRVAGYSAYFTLLSTDMQESIIARTEQRIY